MSCICDGYLGCPCCSPEPKEEKRECPECCGDGFFYYDSDNDWIDKKQYDSLPDDKRTSDVCQECDGTGKITI